MGDSPARKLQGLKCVLFLVCKAALFFGSSEYLSEYWLSGS